MPKITKESVDLPDFAKESVAQIQILYTFQARAAKGRRVWRETRALGAHPVSMERHAKRRGRGAPLTESDFCLRGPSPQNLHN
ncbi:MAG: hypothetical protein E7C81_02610 [Atopobium sp.]|nr:hypothetical protein [Atopobium sp.]